MMIDPTRYHHARLVTAILFVVVGAVIAWLWSPPATFRVGTFNIETFPKSERQIDGAFDAIDTLDVSLLAVQEITDSARLRRAARQRLGDAWRFAAPSDGPELTPGVLYDASMYTRQTMRVHDETVIYDGARPVVEVEFRHASGIELEMFVVHFKAGSEGLELRKEQHAHLTDILRAHANDQRATVLLGDFNATEPYDRELLGWLKRHFRMRWASKSVDCTGYWIPDDHCSSFSLDHILTDTTSGPARAYGPCRTQGCDPGQQCPTFHRHVSDHCPLAVTIAR